MEVEDVGHLKDYIVILFFIDVLLLFIVFLNTRPLSHKKKEMNPNLYYTIVDFYCKCGFKGIKWYSSVERR
jgi:hypothetical protein